MQSRTRKWLVAGALAAMLPAGLAAWSLGSGGAEAADHNDPSTRIREGAMDHKADIADLYIWHQSGKIVAVLGFGGPQMPSESGGTTPIGNYDRDVLFTVEIDTDADNMPDHTL